ncbi:MAG TPA: XRE family transcriptional regulator [Steroidobacteraceae bacterium]|nr:XRE family transcriptional regulator [Steroidobacteraceae bacterium]
MNPSADIATIQALRSDVALQIARFLQRQELSQAAAAKALDIPQPTLSKIANGRVSELSLELLLRIAVRAGLQLVLQIGSVPEEAGAFLSTSMPAARTGVRSKVADEARDALLATARELTPQQRLDAHLEHSKLVASLHRAGQRSR